MSLNGVYSETFKANFKLNENIFDKYLYFCNYLAFVYKSINYALTVFCDY